MSVNLQSRIRSILHKTGEEITAQDVRSKKGRQELTQLPIRSIYQEEIETCLRLLDVIGEEVTRYKIKIIKQAQVSQDSQLLMSIPGISFYSALLITSEIGDHTRFPSSRKLCSWAGLVPAVYASGGKTRRGRIIKQGSKNLRFVLLQAVPHVKRKSKRLNRLYERVARKHGKNTARIAVARKLLAIILMMLKTRKKFDADH
jgi:transposase